MIHVRRPEAFDGDSAGAVDPGCGGIGGAPIGGGPIGGAAGTADGAGGADALGPSTLSAGRTCSVHAVPFQNLAMPTCWGSGYHPAGWPVTASTQS
jgi:hypothetical protein